MVLLRWKLIFLILSLLLSLWVVLSIQGLLGHHQGSSFKQAKIFKFRQQQQRQSKDWGRLHEPNISLTIVVHMDFSHSFRFSTISICNSIYFISFSTLILQVIFTLFNSLIMFQELELFYCVGMNSQHTL